MGTDSKLFFTYPIMIIVILINEQDHIYKHALSEFCIYL